MNKYILTGFLVQGREKVYIVWWDKGQGGVQGTYKYILT